jgi:hypothetical protein
MSEEMSSDQDLESVTARITAHDLARLDRMAERRGVERNQLISQAIDALLANEAWSGGFIPPPPAATIPPPLERRRHTRRRWFRR